MVGLVGIRFFLGSLRARHTVLQTAAALLSFSDTPQAAGGLHYRSPVRPDAPVKLCLKA